MCPRMIGVLFFFSTVRGVLDVRTVGNKLSMHLFGPEATLLQDEKAACR